MAMAIGTSAGRKRPWYELPMMIALAGAFIAVIGQLAGTLVDIYYSPSDTTDFIVEVHPDGLPLLPGGSTSAQVTVTDYYGMLHSYAHAVELKYVVQPPVKPQDLGLSFIPRKTSGKLYPQRPCERASLNWTMRINVGKDCPPERYTITLQVVGGDGRIRNCTYYLEVMPRG